MLNGKEPEDVEIEAIDQALVLHADHELNASTFAARVCVATLSDVYSGITSAIGTLKGPLHGGANEQVMAMLTEIGEEEKCYSICEKQIGQQRKNYGNGSSCISHRRSTCKTFTAHVRKANKVNRSRKMVSNVC